MATDPAQAASVRGWTVNPADPSAHRVTAHRPVRVAGLTGYVDPLGVRPGQTLRVHLSAPAAHEISVGRLGRDALLRPEPDDAADRAEVTWLAHASSARAHRHDIHPGSYGVAATGPLRRPAAVSAWVRLWRLPATVETSAWAAVISDLDYPDRCAWALGIDADGVPGCYLGDGGHHDRLHWTFAGSSLRDRLGEWVHLAFSVAGGPDRPGGERGAARPLAAAGALGRYRAGHWWRRPSPDPGQPPHAEPSWPAGLPRHRAARLRPGHRPDPGRLCPLRLRRPGRLRMAGSGGDPDTRRR